MIYASTGITSSIKALCTVFDAYTLSVGYSMNAHGGTGKQKSQARATVFLLLFLLLVPTVLAIGYTGSITGDSVIAEGTSPESSETSVSPQADSPATAVLAETAETPDFTEQLVTEEPEPTHPELTEENQPQDEPEETPNPEIIEPETITENEQPQNETETGQTQETPQEPETEINETVPITEPEPEINETQPITEPETNETAQSEPVKNETQPEPVFNETNITEPAEPAYPEPCNITCGECEFIEEANCTCTPVEDCQISQPPFVCLDDDECDDYDNCTADACLNGTCQYQPVAPCCGNGECEDDEDPEYCPADCEEPAIPEVPLGPAFIISFEAPSKATRGATAEFSATIENTGKGPAFDVTPHWMLPDGLQLITSNNDCDVLLPGTDCVITGQVYIEPEAIGRKEIRILVNYE